MAPKATKLKLTSDKTGASPPSKASARSASSQRSARASQRRPTKKAPVAAPLKPLAESPSEASGAQVQPTAGSGALDGSDAGVASASPVPAYAAPTANEGLAAVAATGRVTAAAEHASAEPLAFAEREPTVEIDLTAGPEVGSDLTAELEVDAAPAAEPEAGAAPSAEPDIAAAPAAELEVGAAPAAEPEKGAGPAAELVAAAAPATEPLRPPNSAELLSQMRRFDDTELLSQMQSYSGEAPELPAEWSLVRTVEWTGQGVSVLPRCIGRLANVQTLAVDRNGLTSLPESIGQLRTLTRLEVDTNTLASLPESIGELTALEELWAYDNALTSLPESIGRMTALKTLLVRNNQLASLPESIGELRLLEELDVHKNFLTSLPTSLSQLTGLRVLRANANRLVTLAAPVAALSKLTELVLSDNPLQQPPFSVASQGLAAVRRYLVELDRGASMLSRWGKLVLLGSGEVGKTSLLRALQRGRPDPTGGEADRTVQLSLTVLALAMADGAHAMLSCWDVGGQPDYEALQQPYISTGPLFGLTVPAHRANDTNYVDALGRWLDALQAGAPGAIVQPILSHADRLLPGAMASNDSSVAHLLARTSEMATFGAPDALVSSGRFMYEATLETVGAAVLAGWAPPTFPRSDSGAYAYVGNVFGWSWSVTQKHMIASPNELTPTPIGATDGDVIGLAIDIDAGAVHFGCNGRWDTLKVDSTTLRAGVYPAISGNTCIVLLNLGAAPFRYPLDGFAPIQPSAALGMCERLCGLPAAFRLTPVWQLQALEKAARESLAWLRQRLAEHGEAHKARWAASGAKAPPAPLRIMEGIPVVSAIEGGELSMRAAREQFERLVASEPPLLPSIGFRIPATWAPPMAMVRALRDGADPIAAARRAAAGLRDEQGGGGGGGSGEQGDERGSGGGERGDESAGGGGEDRGGEGGTTDAAAELDARMAYISDAELHDLWQRVARNASVPADAALLEDSLALLNASGEVFRSSELVFLDPAFTTEPLKPLVDHRLNSLFVLQKERDPRRAKVLVAGVDALVKHGELREEILPLLWQESGLHPEDYERVLQMLSKAGVLFVAEETPSGRRWVMPTRLPKEVPFTLRREMLEAADEEVTASLTIELGHWSPPGLMERILADCYRHGRYHKYWRRGALIHVPLTGGAASARLVLRLHEPESAERKHHLAIALFGPADHEAALGAKLQEVREMVDGHLRTFPGLLTRFEGRLQRQPSRLSAGGTVTTGPPAAAALPPAASMAAAGIPAAAPSLAPDVAMKGTAPALTTAPAPAPALLAPAASAPVPTAMAPAPATSAPAPAALVPAPATPASTPATTQPMLSAASPSMAAALAPTSSMVVGAPASLAPAPAPALAPAAAEGTELGAELRFVSEFLVFGLPIRASFPLHETLGVTKRRLGTLLLEEEEAVIREVSGSGSSERDPYGWADADWLRYICDESAQERALPPGMPSNILDQGHAGLCLSDFVSHPNARAAKLDTAQVLALRLYTCSVYRSINNPLRRGCTKTQPHPFPALVAHLTEGLKQLRSAALQGGDNSVGSRVLWRGVRDRGVVDEFFERGAPPCIPVPSHFLLPALPAISTNCESPQPLQPSIVCGSGRGRGRLLALAGGTECAPMSTTSDRRVAEEYATRPDANGTPRYSLLFKIVVDNFLHCGADISFLSVSAPLPHTRAAVSRARTQPDMPGARRHHLVKMQAQTASRSCTLLSRSIQSHLNSLIVCACARVRVLVCTVLPDGERVALPAKHVPAANAAWSGHHGWNGCRTSAARGDGENDGRQGNRGD